MTNAIQTASDESPHGWVNRSGDRLMRLRPKLVNHLTHIVCMGLAMWHIAAPARASSIALDNDLPEEVLRAEIITEARSPIDGKALSATEFAELVVTAKQQVEREDANLVTDNPKVKETLFLLRLRSFLRSVGVPIK